MIVVSNTSPLTNLASIGHLDLLHHLYSTLHIADAMWDELRAGGRRWPGADEVSAADWIQRREVQNQSLVITLRRDLDRGEAESIALALELNAELILLDEKEGRHAAQQLGLRPVGVVGILLEAKAMGAIGELRPQLDALRHTAGFHLSQSVYRAALELAGEEDG